LVIRNIIGYEKFWQIFAVMIMVGIFINSSLTVDVDKNPLLIPHFDKLLHLVTWMILSISLCFSMQTYLFSADTSKFFGFFIIISIAIIYGLFDEIHQFFVPSRVMDVFDLFADVVGTILAVIIAYYILKLTFGAQN
jgi:VanZ family protein